MSQCREPTRRIVPSDPGAELQNHDADGRQVSDADAGLIADWLKPLAAPAALPKTGDQLPLGQIVLGGLGLVALGIRVRFFARRTA